ncbi:MAG: outer membrane protein assembly factor BamE [Pseudomonadota bacterium]
MLRNVAIALSLLSVSVACAPSQTFHGYLPDEARPDQITPGEDTKTTVLARLGTPSTKSIFDDNTWIYMSSVRERFAFYRPKTTVRDITAIKFDEDNGVAEVLKYNMDDGEVIEYASRITPTRGRELSLLEQIFGTVGQVRLPQTDDLDPTSPTGRRRGP